VSAGTLHERYTRELRARSFEADAAQVAALVPLEALRTRLLERNPGSIWRRLLPTAWARPPATPGSGGVYLYGGVGRGKTLLLDLFYDSLPMRQRRRSHFHHFMRNVHEQLARLRARPAPLEVLARELAHRIRVLCLDELYVSDIADAMILGALFEALLRRGVALVITSNLAPHELYRDGLQRSRFLPTIALLEHRLEQCPLDGATDYRLRQLRRIPIYLDSRDPDSNARMQSLFMELAAGHRAGGTTLRLLGRNLNALGCRADVVWFDFATLCEGSRSQNDYLELAQEFRTVLLSDVPLFDAPEHDDAARRFIALVDEFYDQGTKLVVSAAAAPAQLYRGERLQLEFQRTASRLIEMQTADYLARPRRDAEDLPTEHFDDKITP
jgi:cell division protein ZapE